MLKRKVGVLSTRSPHRPNPIGETSSLIGACALILILDPHCNAGVTLARIDSVDKSRRLVRLSACDLVHGTPVLDIKPYVPFYDSERKKCIR